MPNQSIPPRPHKVFHFENDPNLVAIYQKAFLKRHFIYRNFRYPPKNFIKLIREEEPDFIIMDTSMPKMDGFSAVQLLKNYKDTSSIPVLGLSDVDSWVGVRWANNLYIDDYWMHTEHTPEEVVEKVASILTPKPSHEKSGVLPQVIQRNKRQKKYLYYAYSGLFAILVAAIFLYFYPGEVGRYAKRFPELAVNITTNTYIWNYGGEEYTLERNLYAEIDDFYAHHPVKVFEGEMSAKEYYINFLNNLEIDRDDLITDVVEALSNQATLQTFSEDETVDFVVRFVQSIPYDYEKRQSMLDARAENYDNVQRVVDDIDASFFPRFPYETLFDQKGICTDKTFLAIALLEKMGFGTALFDMDRHVAPGIQCTTEHSSFNSGYCYIETTSTGFVIGQIPNVVEEFGQAIPQNIQAGSEGLPDISNDNFIVSFVRVFEVSKGKSYGGYVKREPIIKALKEMEKVYKQQLISLQELELELSNLLVTIDGSKAQVTGALETYNTTHFFEDYELYRDAQTQLQLHEQEYDLKIKERDIALIHIEELIVQYQSLADFSKIN